MINKKCGAISLLLILIILFTGCQSKFSNKDMAIIEKNGELLMQNLSNDIKHLTEQDAIRTSAVLASLNIKKFKSISMEETGVYCYYVKIVDEKGNVYFLTIGNFGGLEEVQKNSLNGKKIYEKEFIFSDFAGWDESLVKQP